MRRFPGPLTPIVLLSALCAGLILLMPPRYALSAQSLFEEAVRGETPQDSPPDSPPDAPQDTPQDAPASPEGQPSPSLRSSYGHASPVELGGRIRTALFGAYDMERITDTVAEGSLTVTVRPGPSLSGMITLTADPEGARLEETRLAWRHGAAAGAASGAASGSASGSASGALELMGGYTILTWGRTDGIAPTEIINPPALSRTAVEPDDQRQARWLASAQWRSGGVRGQIVFLPDYVGREVPAEAVASLTAAGGAPLAGAAAGADAPDAAPDDARKDPGVAARLSWDGPDLSASLIGYAGPNPEWGIPSRVERLYLGGVNMELPLGRQVVRLDSAFRYPHGDHREPAVPRPDLRSVFAVERNLPGGAMVLVQYHNTWVAGWRAQETEGPYALNALLFDQAHQVLHGVSGNLTLRWFYDTLTATFGGQYTHTTGEYQLRPTIEYDLGGGARLRGGYRYLNGPGDTRFGLLGGYLSGPFIEATLRF